MLLPEIRCSRLLDYLTRALVSDLTVDGVQGGSDNSGSSDPGVDTSAGGGVGGTDYSTGSIDGGNPAGGTDYSAASALDGQQAPTGGTDYSGASVEDGNPTGGTDFSGAGLGSGLTQSTDDTSAAPAPEPKKHHLFGL